MIKNTILVLSGKGGVGKSTVASNLAVALSKKGFNTGLLDIDIHGPSVPSLFGVENAKIYSTNNLMHPYQYNDNLKLISVGFLLANFDDPIVWRGPMKAGVVKQFIKEVDWGDLDYLIVDCPPGTGDEVLSIVNLIENAKAVIVTTPQKLALIDAKKAINFCKNAKVNILGIIENMSGFICPSCSNTVDIFKSCGGSQMAQDMDISFLGKIPLEQSIVESSEKGIPFIEAFEDSKTTLIMESIIDKIL